MNRLFYRNSNQKAHYVKSIIEELKNLPAVVECHFVSGKHALSLYNLKKQ